AFVADDRELPRARHDKDQHGIPLARFFHAELPEFLLGNRQRVSFQTPPLNENANLPGRRRLRILERTNDSFVIEPAEKLARPHRCYQLPLAPPPPLDPPPPLNPLKPPPDDELLDHPPPDQPPMNGPPMLE